MSKMQDWAPPEEKFVEIPGVINIIWVSDDPEYYCQPIDLFDHQNLGEGLSDEYGKKNLQTTEQSWFTCNLCECDLKSVVTLRAHCKGTKHVRKALQKKSEYRKRMKKEEEEACTSVKKESSQSFNTLFQWLESTSEAVVGLEHITEYSTGSPGDHPMYHCNLDFCQDAQGNAEDIKNHILSLKHSQGFLKDERGHLLHHQAEIRQAVAQLTNMYARDYRQMKTETNTKVWREIRNNRFKSKKSSERSRDFQEEYQGHGSRKVKTEFRDEHDDRWRRDRSRSPRRVKRERSSDRDNYRNGRRRDYGQDRDRREDRQRSDRYEERRRDENYSVKEERRNDDEVRELSRSGNFDNWSTATIKRPRDAGDHVRDAGHTPGAAQSSVSSSRVSSLDDDVKRLHARVAKIVKDNLNKYYQDARDLDKIATAEDYQRIAKQMSHQLRDKIKESYEAYNGSLEGIMLTGDHAAMIESEVERYFEKIPLVKRR